MDLELRKMFIIFYLEGFAGIYNIEDDALLSIVSENVPFKVVNQSVKMSPLGLKTKTKYFLKGGLL